MQIIAASPFSSASLIWQPRPGVWALTVICKATFTLLPGESSLAPAPDPPNDADDHWNDDPRRSLHAASDLVPFKRRVDVVLVGHAYAARGQPVSSLVARLGVAGVDKAVEVHADRVWTPDGHLREGARFTRMPLRWERAAGGPDTMNPVGVPPNARPDVYGQVPVPNLQPPGIYVGWREDVIPPIGFGPIASWWPARRALLHRHAATWDPARWAEQPLPPDIDAAFFNVAPPDQQVEELHADERITLENLHPEHARLVTRLPGLVPRATVEREAAAGVQPIRMRCDALSIDTDRCVCHLVWRGQIALARPDERGRVTIAAELPGPEEIAETIAPGLVGPALPFGGGPAPAVIAAPGPVPATGAVHPLGPVPGISPTAASAFLPDDDVAKTLPPGGNDASETLFLSPAMVANATLPFQDGRSPWAALPLIPEETKLSRTDDDDTGTLFGALVSTGDTLPFAPPAPPEPPPPAARPPDFPPPSQEPDTERPTEHPPPMMGPPLMAMPGSFGPQPLPLASLAWSAPEEKRDAPVPLTAHGALAIPDSPATPAPPPMLAPLAAGIPLRDDPPARAAAAPPLELVPVAPQEPDPEPIPIERAAAISAEIAEEKAPRTDVLRKHDLTERVWIASERRWAKAIDDEAAQGSSKLRAAHDRAYVEAVEGFRGPITLPEYARIVVGLERGRANQVLEDLQIQRPALMRIVRLWTKKVATDAKLGEEAAGLLTKLRAS